MVKYFGIFFFGAISLNVVFVLHSKMHTISHNNNVTFFKTLSNPKINRQKRKICGILQSENSSRTRKERRGLQKGKRLQRWRTGRRRMGLDDKLLSYSGEYSLCFRLSWIVLTSKPINRHQTSWSKKEDEGLYVRCIHKIHFIGLWEGNGNFHLSFVMWKQQHIIEMFDRV